MILYVNGLPLVFIELENSNIKLRSAFDDNLKNYRHDIPQLFHCNAFCMLSNAVETKVGSLRRTSSTTFRGAATSARAWW